MGKSNSCPPRTVPPCEGVTAPEPISSVSLLIFGSIAVGYVVITG
jgi:hypothetical protein